MACVASGEVWRGGKTNRRVQSEVTVLPTSTERGEKRKGSEKVQDPALAAWESTAYLCSCCQKEPLLHVVVPDFLSPAVAVCFPEANVSIEVLAPPIFCFCTVYASKKCDAMMCLSCKLFCALQWAAIACCPVFPHPVLQCPSSLFPWLSS